MFRIIPLFEIHNISAALRFEDIIVHMFSTFSDTVEIAIFDRTTKHVSLVITFNRFFWKLQLINNRETILFGKENEERYRLLLI